MTESYEVVLEPRAEKELDKVPASFYPRIDKAILQLSKNPRPFGVKKLDEDIHRIRVNDWRILYAIFDEEKRVVIIRVVKRNERTYK